MIRSFAAAFLVYWALIGTAQANASETDQIVLSETQIAELADLYIHAEFVGRAANTWKCSLNYENPEDAKEFAKIKNLNEALAGHRAILEDRFPAALKEARGSHRPFPPNMICSSPEAALDAVQAYDAIVRAIGLLVAITIGNESSKSEL